MYEQRGRWKRHIVMLAVSAALLIGLVTAAGPWQLADRLADANLTLVGLALVLYLTALSVRALRWSLLLRAARHPVPGAVALSQYAMGMALNDLTPGRVVGEGARIWGVNRLGNVPLGTGLATVMAEKVMDLVLVTSVLLASVAVLYPAIPLRTWGSLAAMSAAIAAVNLALIIVLRRPGTVEWGGRVSTRIARRFRNGKYAGDVEDGVGQTIESFEMARLRSVCTDRNLVVLATVLTVPIWALEFARLTVIMASLGVAAPLTAVVIASSLGMTLQVFLPAGSGNVAAIADIFAAIGVPFATATAAGLLSVATSIWISVPIALAALVLTARREVTGPSTGASDRRGGS